MFPCTYLTHLPPKAGKRTSLVLLLQSRPHLGSGGPASFSTRKGCVGFLVLGYSALHLSQKAGSSFLCCNLREKAQHSQSTVTKKEWETQQPVHLTVQDWQLAEPTPPRRALLCMRSVVKLLENYTKVVLKIQKGEWKGICYLTVN